jgi:hypothetical protein
MALVLVWGASLLVARNLLVQLAMTFLLAVLFIAQWSILFHQTVSV